MILCCLVVYVKLRTFIFPILDQNGDIPIQGTFIFQTNSLYYHARKFIQDLHESRNYFNWQ